ncbi:MAG TPA: HAMP domain-containing sensor histidine kinase [Patescibacteria group bacterium]|nr:HAMP domain-containing sensor histidine kinase [Gammaproteobacteria bacterium]HWA51447.1 HAMP domain-containing sensor histidine kinase [Patescibacteria group bacterium]
MLIGICIFFGTYFFSRQTFDQQVKTWITIVPQHVLVNLIDSDNFSIVREVELIESTGLFSDFLITDNQKIIIQQFGSATNELSRKLIPIQDEAKVTWGYYSYNTNFNKFLMPFLMLELLMSILIIPLYLWARWRLTVNLETEFIRFNDFIAEIELLAKKIEMLENIQDEQDFLTSNIRYTAEEERINQAISKLIHEILQSRAYLKKFITETEHKKLQEELSRTALKVAHDIRSPLAALDMIIQSTMTLPEDNRILFRNAVWRIRDIANTLLKKNSINPLTQQIEEDEHFTKQLLSSVINMLITEKRMQYRSKPNIEIENIFNSDSYGLFAMIKISDFKRILSNLINNAVESLTDTGKITIKLLSNEKKIEIWIQDNGRGIPVEVLKILGQPGVTYGKQDGHGLGVYYAKNTLDSWGGKLIIESELGKGTSVKVCLPKTPSPSWFVPILHLYDKQHLAIVDDDISIHELWKERIKQYTKMENIKITLHQFHSPDEIKNWFQNIKIEKNNVTYLFDYEFIGYEETGLDLIQNLSINDRSILVTSHIDDRNILLQCEALGVSIIPKDLVSLIPIKNISNTLHKIDAILIDDDPLTHTMWELSASRYNKNFLLFTSANQFLSSCDGFLPETPIYIDADLGNGIKGEIVSEEIFINGFKNIYLATGKQPLNFKNISWLKGVVSKTPPWEEKTL